MCSAWKEYLTQGLATRDRKLLSHTGGDRPDWQQQETLWLHWRARRPGLLRGGATWEEPKSGPQAALGTQPWHMGRKDPVLSPACRPQPT